MGNSITEELVLLEILEIESGRDGELIGIPFNPDDTDNGFTDDPLDTGGKTAWGVTEKTLKGTGSNTPIEELTLGEAYGIFRDRYYVKSGADRIMAKHPHLARAVCNFAIHAGHSRAVKFLQLELNTSNDRARLWPDLVVDGGFGMKTLGTLERYLKHRKRDDGYSIFFNQYLIRIGSFYQYLTERTESQERFAFGWAKRVFHLFKEFYEDK